MATSVLLGMSENMGTALIPGIAEAAGNRLSIDRNIVSLAHSLPHSLARYHPDILLLSPTTMTYDSPNEEDELVKYIYEIRSNPTIAGTRIAVILKQNNSLISKLIALNIWDIFLTNGNFETAKLVNQLLRPPSMQNVADFMNMGDLPDLQPPVSPMSTTNASSGFGDADDGFSQSASSVAQVPQESVSEIAELRQELDEVRERESRLAANLDASMLPREDYDDLLRQFKNKANAASLSEQLKNQIMTVLDHEEKQQARLEDLSKTVKDQHELIKKANMAGGAEAVNRLKQENFQLKRQLEQANSRVSALTNKINNSVNNYSNYSTKPRSTPSPTHRPRDDDYDYDERAGSPLKTLLIAIAAIFLLGLGAVGVALMSHASSNPGSQASSSSSKQTFSSLLKQGEYAKAAKLYKEQATEAENQMLQDNDVTDRSSVAKQISKYSTADPIQLDVAYFDKDFNKVVDIWNESTDANVTQPIDQRRIMIAYALMKTNNLADAKKVAKPLNSDSFNQRIKVYEQFYQANKILENKIKNGDLSEKEKEKAKKQIQTNKEAMDKL